MVSKMSSRAKIPPEGKPKNGAAVRGSSTPVRQGPKTGPRPAATRSFSAPPRKPAYVAQPNWLHPNGARLEDLSEKALLKGVVTRVAYYGVFVDVGAERNAFLGIPARFWKRFRRGDRIDQCSIQTMNLETRQFAVTMEDPEAVIAANHRSLEELIEGSYVDGVVVDKSPAGTFVNIGAVKDGRLAVPRSIGIKLCRGQVLHNVLIENVNLKRERISLKLDNPAQAIAEMEMVGFHLTKRMDNSGAKTKSKMKEKPILTTNAKMKAAPLPASDRYFMKGDFVDGVVTDIAAKGVTVNIGAKIFGTLIVSAELKNEFQKGDRVQGMKIEKINASSGAITLSVEDPELEVDEVVVRPKPKAKGKLKAKHIG